MGRACQQTSDLPERHHMDRRQATFPRGGGEETDSDSLPSVFEAILKVTASVVNLQELNCQNMLVVVTVRWSTLCQKEE